MPTDKTRKSYLDGFKLRQAIERDISSARRLEVDERESAGHVTCSEAWEILWRYDASHRGDEEEEHARYPDSRDPSAHDEIRMAAFIDRVELLERTMRELASDVTEALELVGAEETD
jgi:hypothetical protein